MVRESLARRFRPAGFEQPEGSRQNYVKPRKELQELFYRFIRELPFGMDIYEIENQYNKALNFIERIGEISGSEANSLLVDFKPKELSHGYAGLFLSACYTHSAEENIIFDVDAPKIVDIGHRTNKNIFNNGRVGMWFASRSSGTSVNNGECMHEFAWESSGPSINNGISGGRFGYNSLGTIVFAKGIQSFTYAEDRLVITRSDWEAIPELKRYTEELCNLTKSVKDEESAKKFIEKYGTRGEKIEPEIKDILERNGFAV